jgi:hypothetical protein
LVFKGFIKNLIIETVEVLDFFGYEEQILNLFHLVFQLVFIKMASPAYESCTYFDILENDNEDEDDQYNILFISLEPLNKNVRYKIHKCFY